MEYKCEGVSKSYSRFNKRHPVGVKNATLSFQTGEIIGVVGTSKSGKTSLIDILSGKCRANEGSLNYNGKAISKVYSEEGLKLNKNLSVYDNMVHFGKHEKMSEIDVENRMAQLRDIFSLSKYINTKVGELDEGNRVKCELAMLLLTCPRILFVDDAFVFLNNVVRTDILKCLKRLNKQERTVIVIAATHVSDVDKIINRIVITSKGSIIYDGNITSFKKKYCTKKSFEVFLNKNVSISRIDGLDVVESSDYYYKLLFNNEEGMFAKVISLFDVNNIIDLKIGDQSLSDLIEIIKKEDER